MGGGVTHFLLHADESAGQQKTEDLTATAVQGFEAKRRAFAQSLARRIDLTLVDHGFMQLSLQPSLQLTLFKRLQQLPPIGAVGDQQRQACQQALRAAKVGHGFPESVAWAVAVAVAVAWAVSCGAKLMLVF